LDVAVDWTSPPFARGGRGGSGELVPAPPLDRELATLTLLDIDEHLADAGKGMSDSTRHHNAVALERLQKFALEHQLLSRPVFGKLEKPRTGQPVRIPTADETAAILADAFRALLPPFARGGRGGGAPC
jgi:hypothetical protein